MRTQLSATPVNEEAFSFLIISDTHYGETEPSIPRVHKYWQNSPYNFLVVAGDITQRGLPNEWEEFDRDCKTLETPVYLAIGNHDLFNNGEEQFYNYFGPTHYVQQFGDITLVFLDTGNGVIAKEEKEWYVNMLEQYRGTHIITITHYSLITKYVQHMVALPNPDEFYWLASVNAAYGVEAMISGHLHNNFKERFRDVDYYTITDISDTEEHQGIHVRYENNELSFERVEIE